MFGGDVLLTLNTRGGLLLMGLERKLTLDLVVEVPAKQLWQEKSHNSEETKRSGLVEFGCPMIEECCRDRWTVAEFVVRCISAGFVSEAGNGHKF